MSEEVKQDVVDETTENTVNDAENTVDAGDEAVEAEVVEDTEEAVVDATQVLEELKNEFDNRYKRLQADFDNFRRRTNQEKEQLSGFVKGNVLADLLPVLDNFERAVQSPAEGDAKTFLDGFVMIHQNLPHLTHPHLT